MIPLLAVLVPLAWNAPPEPVSYYNVWRDGAMVTSSLVPTVKVDLPRGENVTLTVTAVNEFGESPRSESITIYVPPEPKLTIQFSADLETWMDLPFPEARYYRIKKEYP